MSDSDPVGTAPGDADEATRRDGLACLRCGARVEAMGVHELRTGGSTGAAHLLFGQWAELGEEKLSVAVFACRVCRHLEFRVPS